MAETPTTTEQAPGVDRRRAQLPQPDFTFYKKAEAYPGPGYFFVGHSYNVEIENTGNEAVAERSNALKAFFETQERLVPVGQALGSQDFFRVLTRFEQDLLTRLPESALVGPAIDSHGKVIDQSFTVWRQERRRPRN